MLTTGDGWTHDLDSLMGIRHNGIFQRMTMPFTTVVMFLFARMVRSADGSFRGINNNFIFILNWLYCFARGGFKVTMG